VSETDRDIILRLLKDAAAAHGKHEAEELGGVYDEQWPEWYSTHMVDQLHAEGLRLVE
jgi:23S rRNA maturation-related 3'-5' exoribonuclease YhaM